MGRGASPSSSSEDDRYSSVIIKRRPEQKLFEPLAKHRHRPLDQVRDISFEEEKTTSLPIANPEEDGVIISGADLQEELEEDEDLMEKAQAARRIRQQRRGISSDQYIIDDFIAHTDRAAVGSAKNKPRVAGKRQLQEPDTAEVTLQDQDSSRLFIGNLTESVRDQVAAAMVQQEESMDEEETLHWELQQIRKGSSHQISAREEQVQLKRAQASIHQAMRKSALELGSLQLQELSLDETLAELSTMQSQLDAQLLSLEQQLTDSANPSITLLLECLEDLELAVDSCFESSAIAQLIDRFSDSSHMHEFDLISLKDFSMQKTLSNLTSRMLKLLCENQWKPSHLDIIDIVVYLSAAATIATDRLDSDFQFLLENYPKYIDAKDTVQMAQSHYFNVLMQSDFDPNSVRQVDQLKRWFQSARSTEVLEKWIQSAEDILVRYISQCEQTPDPHSIPLFNLLQTLKK